MDIDSIKQEIADQITITSLSNSSRWNRSFLTALDNKEIASSEMLLKKIVKDYRTSILSLILISATALFAFSIRFVGKIDFSDLTNVILNAFLPLMILIIIVQVLINTFRFQKMKVDQEHKVFLNRLLEKIDK